MKSEAIPRVGILDALTSGLQLASRRPALVVVPALIDLSLWLAPRLAIGDLLRRFLAVWEALLRATYSPTQLSAMGDMLTIVRQTIGQVGTQVNLTDSIAGSWLGPPSALLATQATRMTFVSEVILAPAGLSLSLPQVVAAPWQPATVEVGNLWLLLLVLGGLWAAGQLLVTFYLRWAASGILLKTEPDEAGAQPWSGLRGFLGLAARLIIFSLLLGAIVFLIRIPLSVAATVMVLTGSAAAGLLFVLVGGMTLWLLLWFLTSFFFVSEGILFEKQPLWRSILQSLSMVRGNSLATMGLVLVINLLVLGFHAVWGLLGRTPGGAVVAILGNAYLGTSMLLGIFVYYVNLRKRWQSQMAQAALKQKEFKRPQN